MLVFYRQQIGQGGLTPGRPGAAKILLSIGLFHGTAWKSLGSDIHPKQISVRVIIFLDAC